MKGSWRKLGERDGQKWKNLNAREGQFRDLRMREASVVVSVGEREDRYWERSRKGSDGDLVRICVALQMRWWRGIG